MADFGPKWTILSQKWTFLGQNDIFFGKLLSLNDICESFRHYHSSKIKPFNPEMAPKNPPFWPKVPDINDISSPSYVWSIFRYIMMLKMRTLKFMYSPKIAIFVKSTLVPVSVNKYWNSFPAYKMTLLGEYHIFPRDFRDLKY